MTKNLTNFFNFPNGKGSYGLFGTSLTTSIKMIQTSKKEFNLKNNNFFSFCFRKTLQWSTHFYGETDGNLKSNKIYYSAYWLISSSLINSSSFHHIKWLYIYIYTFLYEINVHLSRYCTNWLSSILCNKMNYIEFKYIKPS